MTWHGRDGLYFPHRVNVRNLVQDPSGTDLVQALPAWWCLQNLNPDDWLYDPQGFEFRYHADAVWFSMVWG